MRWAWISLSLGSLLALAATARAGPVLTFTDIEQFRAAAGPLVEIDFSLSPDGSPSPLIVPIQITPDFNYTDFGVTFSSPQPELRLLGHSEGGGTLFAVSESSIRNWIEAQFDPPVFAVGVNTLATFSVYDFEGVSLAESPSAGFIGFASETPIHLGVIDRGSNGAAITSILFEPVPEPAILLLVGAGALVIARRR